VGRLSANAFTTQHNITIDGDMKFGAMTVAAGDELDLNSQRVEFTGAFDLTTGALAMNDAMAVFTNTIDFNGRVPTSNTGTTIIHNPPSTSEKLITSLYFGGTFFAQGAESDVNGYAWGGSSGEYPAKVFVGGQLDCQQSVKTTTTMQVATGGELRGNDRTITCEGDFTMSGGLLGTSAVEFNGSDESAANASATTWGFGSSLSIEFWFKTSFNGSSTVLDLAPSSGNNDRIQVLQTASEMAFKLWNSGGTSYQIGTTAFTINPDDGKWHHLAFTSDGSTQKIYYDGRLAGEASHTITRAADPTLKLTIGMHSTLGSHYSGFMDELRFFSDVRTVGELRTDMFQGGTLADSGALVARYKFDEGTGTAIDNSQATAARDLVASGTGVWVGGGTYDKTGGPAIVMAGTTQDITCKNGLDIYDLTINDGSTTSIHTIDNSAGRLDVYGNLTVNEKLTSSASSNTSGITMKAAATTLTVASDVKTTALATLYQVVLDHGGTTEIDEMNLKVVELQSGATLKATGDFTVTTELEVGGACTLNANGKTLTCKLLDMNGTGTLNLVDSTLILSSTDGLTTTSNTILNGGPGTTVSGSSAATTFESQNNFVIVGNITNLNVTNEELSILGNVTNCTGDIHRWNPTIDTGQMLDADTADDRDVRLGSDLDRNTELVT
jgi:hypothetical protein